MIPDEEYIKLYELFKSMMPVNEDDSQKVVIYHPELFVEMAKEIVRLRKENYQLRVSNASHLTDREYANRLAEQLKCIKDDLDRLGIRLPYKFR